MTANTTHLAIALIDPELGFKLIIWGGWLLTLMGTLKVVIWAFGEFAPQIYAKIPSESIRNMLTGKMNRLFFGLGGFIFALLGLVFVALGIFFERVLVHRL